ncbi:MAG: hypothetical protein IKN38_09340 [Clostridia bacterium]|nr:hypothetical protein [Clostridia bacterium]
MNKGLKVIIIILGVLLIIAAVLFIIMKILGHHRSDPSDVIKYDTTNPLITEVTQISCHRGGAELMPEESMIVFEHCVAREDFEPDAFEFDLHITKDDVLILLHDDTLDRTTDSEEVFGEKDVRPEDKTYDELRRLNVGAKFVDSDGNMPYASLHGDEVPDDLRVVRLEDVLDFLSSHGDFNYIIEIKNGGELGCRGVDIMYEILKERDLLDNVAFGTFNAEVSEYVDSAYKGKINRSTSIKEVIRFWLAAIFDSDGYEPPCSVLQIPFCDPYLSYGINLGTARCINYAHKHDMALQYWTVNDREDMEYLVSMGADCIMTDSPDVLYDVIYGNK